jgi:proteic killer suppression protein
LLAAKTKGVPQRWLINCVSFCLPSKTAENLEQVGRFPGWRPHPLKGDLKGFWSVAVTGNWRIVFSYDEKTNTAADIDLVDYH